MKKIRIKRHAILEALEDFITVVLALLLSLPAMFFGFWVWTAVYACLCVAFYVLRKHIEIVDGDEEGEQGDETSERAGGRA